MTAITGEQKLGIVDVLVKVVLRSGEDKILLFHVEIQGYSDDGFPERMFMYYT